MIRKARLRPGTPPNKSCAQRRRRLLFEALEDRRLLAIDAVLLKDINTTLPAEDSTSSPELFVEFGGYTWFRADDGPSGTELWRTDGTVTTQFANLNPNSFAGSNPRNLTVAGGQLFFSASTPATEREVWVTDAASPPRVIEVRPGTLGSNPQSLVNFQGELFFAANDGTGMGLWRTTGAGATPSASLVAGTAGLNPGELTVSGDKLYFTTAPSANPGLTRVYVFDGINTPSPLNVIGGGGYVPMLLTDFHGTLYLSAYSDATGRELFRTSASSIDLVQDINPGGNDSSPLLFKVAGPNLFFKAFKAGVGTKLWRTHSGGTQQVTDPIGVTVPSTNSFAAIGDTLYFVGTSASGTGIFTSDGTTIAPLPATVGMNPTQLTNVGGTLYFTGNASSTGNELWYLNGQSPTLVRDIRPGTAGSFPLSLAPIGSSLFFTADNGSIGYELWLAQDFVSVSTTFSQDADGNLVLSDVSSLADDITLQSDGSGGWSIVDLGATIEPSGPLPAGIVVSGDTIQIPASAAGSFSNFTFNTGEGIDLLTVNYSGGDIGRQVALNGGDPATAPGDRLVIEKGSSSGLFHTITHTFSNSSDGSVALDPDGPGGVAASRIAYVGLEPVIDNLDAAHRVFDFTGGDEAIALSDANGPNMTIDSTLGESVTFTNPLASLTINSGTGDDAVTIVSVDADGPYSAALTINGGTGNDTVNLNADITFAADMDLNIDLVDDDASPGIDTINVGAEANLILSGSGAATLKASRNIALAGVSSLDVVNGDLTLIANPAGTLAGNFIGVLLSGTTVRTSGTGNIVFEGHGGQDDSTTANYGVALNTSTVVSTLSGAAAGSITITGTGGSSLSNSIGIEVLQAEISSVSGAIQLTGAGGSSAGGHNYGMYLQGPLAGIFSAGTSPNAAAIMLEGTGGSGIGGLGIGLFDQSRIESVDGAIDLSGTAPVFGNGVRLDSGSQLITTGTAAVVVAGFSNTQRAVEIVSAATMSLAGANNTLIGDDIGLYGGPIDVGANTITLRPSTSATPIFLGTDHFEGLRLTDAELDTITAGNLRIGNNTSGAITVSANISQPGKNLTLVTGVGLSGTGNITSGSASGTELTIDQGGNSTYGGAIGGVAAGPAEDKNLALNKTGAGTLTLSGASSYTGSTTIAAGQLNVNGSITSNVSVGLGGALGGTGVITGDVSGSGSVGAGNSPGVLTVFGNFSPTGAVLFDVSSPYTAAGTDYDQIVVSGSVALSGSSLSLLTTGNPPPAVPQTLVLIANDGGDPISGVFTGLPEGSSLNIGNTDFTISYVGGKGNDVVLLAIPFVPSTLSATLSGGSLIVTDTDPSGRDNDLTIARDSSGNLVISDFAQKFVAAPPGGTLSNGNKTLTIPLALITGSVIVSGQGGSDAFTVDYSGGPFGKSLIISGSSPASLPGDKLLVMNPSTLLPFVVDTQGGKVDASGDPTLSFSGIEGVDVVDGVLINVAFGNMYARATPAGDFVQFVSLGQINPVFRIRIGNLHYPLSGGNYGPYTTSGAAASRIYVYGRGGNDTLNMYNTRLNPAFFGEGGDDVITGGYGNDLLVGGAGNDRINGATVGGNDEIWGDDFKPALDDPNVASQTALGGDDQINTFGGSDTIYGQGGNDIINSGGGADYISGGDGADQIDGQAGDDRIYGGGGNDLISGGDGNDLLAGNAGSDTLYGRRGNDILIGGIGQDTLHGNEGGDALVGDESNGQGSNSTSRSDAVDAALLALMLSWGAAPTLASLGLFHSSGPDGSTDTLWGGAAADAFFTTALDKAADKNAIGYGPDL